MCWCQQSGTVEIIKNNLQHCEKNFFRVIKCNHKEYKVLIDCQYWNHTPACMTICLLFCLHDQAVRILCILCAYLIKQQCYLSAVPEYTVDAEIRHTHSILTVFMYLKCSFTHDTHVYKHASMRALTPTDLSTWTHTHVVHLQNANTHRATVFELISGCVT